MAFEACVPAGFSKVSGLDPAAAGPQLPFGRSFGRSHGHVHGRAVVGHRGPVAGQVDRQGLRSIVVHLLWRDLPSSPCRGASLVVEPRTAIVLDWDDTLFPLTHVGLPNLHGCFEMC